MERNFKTSSSTIAWILLSRPPFGPPFFNAGAAVALTWLLSNEACFGGSDGAAAASNIFRQIPRSLQRANDCRSSNEGHSKLD